MLKPATKWMKGLLTGIEEQRLRNSSKTRPFRRRVTGRLRKAPATKTFPDPTTNFAAEPMPEPDADWANEGGDFASKTDEITG